MANVTTLAEVVKFGAVSTPSATPAVGHLFLYQKSGTKALYYKDSDGTEHQVGSGGGSVFVSSQNRDASGGVVAAEPLTIVRKSASSTTATLTFSHNHSWQVGQRITVAMIVAASIPTGNPTVIVDQIEIGDDTYTWIAGASSGHDVHKGIDGYESAVSLAYAINHNGVEKVFATAWMGTDNATPSVMIQWATGVGGTPTTGTPVAHGADFILGSTYNSWDIGSATDFRNLANFNATNALILSVSGAQLTYTISAIAGDCGDSVASDPTRTYVSTCTRVAVPANVPCTYFTSNTSHAYAFLPYTPEITVGQEVTLNLIAADSMQFTVNPTAADYITIGSNVWTFQAGASSGFDVQIQGSAGDTLTELVTCINARATESVVSAAGSDSSGNAALVAYYATGSTGSKTATPGLIPEPGIFLSQNITGGTNWFGGMTNLIAYNVLNTSTLVVSQVTTQTFNSIVYCELELITASSNIPSFTAVVCGGTVAPGNLVSEYSGPTLGSSAFDVQINIPANGRRIWIEPDSTGNGAGFSQIRGATPSQYIPIQESGTLYQFAVEPSTTYYLNKNGSTLGMKQMYIDIAES